MKREQFEARVHRYEELEERDPAAFRRGVLLFAALGHLYFGLLALLGISASFAAVLLVLSGHAGVVAMAVLIVALAANVGLAQALMVRVPAPTGVVIENRHSPQLFADLEELRTRLECPAVHQVLLTDEFNASLAQTPRLGAFGWQLRTLSIGLPLLHAMSRPQVRALLAHELGRLSGLHGEFRARICMISTMWDRLASDSGIAAQGFLVRQFVTWYAPRLGARAFALMRAREYEADAASVAVSGVEETARMLLGFHALGAGYAARLNESLMTLARSGARNPPSIAALAIAAATAKADGTGLDESLERMLLRETEYDDTHPSLVDRLEAIGVQVQGGDAKALLAVRGLWPPRVQAPATSEYFPHGTSEVADLLDKFTLENWFADSWEILVDQMEEARKRLAEIDAKRPSDPANEELACERIEVLEFLEGPGAALRFTEQYLEGHPESLRARLHAGRLLLEDDCERGLDLLEDLLGRDRLIADSARQVLYAYYRRTGQHGEARGMLGALDADAEAFERAAEERSTISRKDVFLPHGLSEGELEPFRAAMESSPEVVRAWIVQKQVKELADQKARMVLLEIGPRGLHTSQETAKQKIEDAMMERLDRLPFRFVLFSASDCPAPLRKATKKLEGALVFDRKRKRPGGV
ncbi:MAG: M48 family metalloprotease [Candidatus Sumerlaeia bacterium]|nr:M48 family metalloprotease [Candidatus Sumerlaeia bacterium]